MRPAGQAPSLHCVADLLQRRRSELSECGSVAAFGVGSFLCTFGLAHELCQHATEQPVGFLILVRVVTTQNGRKMRGHFIGSVHELDPVKVENITLTVDEDFGKGDCVGYVSMREAEFLAYELLLFFRCLD
ncbi:uncharacterized protein PG986_013768 [Apiospora aurea]|uniref:Uncharacterized protein n=1 Tax=Apiospora aurea TaxID=335848 RepID=A0ABR1PWI3_9PEZI